MKQHLIIESNSRYFCLGVMINEELFFIEVSIVKTPHNWGIVIIDPDGNSYLKLNDEDSLMAEFKIDDHNYKLCVFNSSNKYEIIFEEI